MVLFQNTKAHRGITLIEVALAIMILSLLSIAVSSLVRSGVEAQLNQRTEVHMQTVAQNIVDDLRFDLRTVGAVAITNGGNTLSLDGGQIVYRLDGSNNFYRIESGVTKLYNPGDMRPRLQVNCQGGCFTLRDLNSRNQPRQVVVSALTVERPLSNRGTIVDQVFGPPNFAIRNFAFDIMTATEFE